MVSLNPHLISTYSVYYFFDHFYSWEKAEKDPRTKNLSFSSRLFTQRDGKHGSRLLGRIIVQENGKFKIRSRSLKST